MSFAVVSARWTSRREGQWHSHRTGNGYVQAAVRQAALCDSTLATGAGRALLLSRVASRSKSCPGSSGCGRRTERSFMTRSTRICMKEAKASNEGERTAGRAVVCSLIVILPLSGLGNSHGISDKDRRWGVEGCFGLLRTPVRHRMYRQALREHRCCCRLRLARRRRWQSVHHHVYW